jgi:hypothetical protein
VGFDEARDFFCGVFGIAAVEAERGGAPEVAPPGRDCLGAAAVLDGEKSDDLAEKFVGEGADVVHRRRFELR